MTVADWLERRTLRADGVDVDAVRDRLVDAGARVSVVIPAREVADTIGPICAAIADVWMGARPLVDELLVVDAASADGTAELARAHGATVVQERDVRPDAAGTGKGAAMWRGLAATRGDLVVWLDGDVVDFDPRVVPLLLAPLLDPAVAYVKGFAERTIDGSDLGGARVSEICARPLLNRYRPDLAGVIHPLSGEAAGRRAVLERVPFATGYAVEIALLLDIHALVGLDAIAQVELGPRRHRNQPTAALGAMAAVITDAVLRRSGTDGTSEPITYSRPVVTADEVHLASSTLEVAELPPLAVA